MDLLSTGNHDPAKARQRTKAWFQDMGFPLNENLPLLENMRLRNPIEVANRISVLCGLGAMYEGVERQRVLGWLKQNKAISRTSASTSELELLSATKLGERELNLLSWKQESLYALCWCSNMIREMSAPEHEANLSNLYNRLPKAVPISEFRPALSLRPCEELYECLDRYYCLSHLAAHPELWANREKSRLNRIIVAERRRELEWVCNHSISIDEITLDT